MTRIEYRFVLHSIRVIREVGMGPDCKTGGWRAEVWPEDFSPEKYL
ncbi:MAG: hypothetical protein WCJ74_01620 [bacterium]